MVTNNQKLYNFSRNMTIQLLVHLIVYSRELKFHPVNENIFIVQVVLSVTPFDSC